MYVMLREVYADGIFQAIIRNWMRYIDDYWILWDSTFGDLQSFVGILEALHPSIAFTMACSSSALNFLDIYVKKVDGRLETSIYHKPTDTRNYVPGTF